MECREPDEEDEGSGQKVEDDDEENETGITHKEALIHLDKVKEFFEQQSLNAAEVCRLQSIVHHDSASKKRRQSSMMDFLQR